MLLLNYLFLEFIIAILVRLLFQKLEELFKLSGIRIEKIKRFQTHKTAWRTQWMAETQVG